MSINWKRSARLEGLPTELLVQILSCLPSRELFTIASTNRRIHAVTQNILLPRLRRLTAEDLRLLLFECYHRLNRTTIHFWHCRYLGSWNNSDSKDQVSTEAQDAHASFMTDTQLESTPDDFDKPREANSMDISSFYSYFEPVSERISNPRKQEEWEPYLNIDISGGTMNALTFEARLVTLNGRKMRFLSLVDVFEARDMLSKEWLEQSCAKGGSVSLDLMGNRCVELQLKVAKPLVLPKVYGPEGWQENDGEYCLKFEGLRIRTALLLLALERNRELPNYS